ncbi:MAG: ABC transporter permease [Candidatus Methanoperedens sp.]|nr:ABC transporter permease [Candidatus Methanoperedens sp.]
MSEGRNQEHLLRIKPVFQNLIPEIVIITFLLAAWQGIYESRLSSEFIVTSPLKTARYLWEPDILRHWSISFERVMVGLSIATVLSVSLLVAGIASSKAHSVLNVLANTLRFIPPIAWIPLAIIWFGIGESSKAYIIIYGGFFPMFLSLFSAYQNLPKESLKLISINTSSKLKAAYYGYVLGLTPGFIHSIRLGFGVAWMSLVAAELIASDVGLGYMIEEGRMLLNTTQVVGGMVLIGLTGYAFDFVLRIAQSWYAWQN